MNDKTINPSGSNDAIQQYLSFKLAGQEYGVDILCVQEIKGWDKPTRIPHSPEHVFGVVNLRGAVVPIIDLRRRFGLERVDSGPTTVVIVVRVNGAKGEQTAGLVVDAVCDVCDVSAANLRGAPDVGSAVDSAVVRGLAMLEDRMVILLDATLLVATCIDAIPAEEKVA